MTNAYIIIFLLCFTCKCTAHSGPDPWHDDTESLNEINDLDLPPDLLIPPKKKEQPNLAHGEWFFRRILSILLKGGQVQTHEDGSVDITLQMKLAKQHWTILQEYLTSSTALSEEMYRRSLGYIEHSIYKPTITDQIVMVWSDYIQIYLEEYKVHITWTLAISGILCALFWCSKNMSLRHFLIIICLVLYLYEVLVSYKEAEKQEVDTFLSALEHCSWYFWRTTCDVPKPDPLIFLKHMNPLKIGIRMFTTVISEPMITLSDTMKIMVHGICNGLWYPLDKIVYGILIVSFNILLVFLLIMIVFNFILNIPFDLSLLGLVSLGVKQRNRTIFSDANSIQTPGVTSGNDGDRISGQTLHRVLDVLQQAMSSSQNKDTDKQQQITNVKTTGIRRSASTGRLPNMLNMFENNNKPLGKIVKRTNINLDGSGDAQPK